MKYSITLLLVSILLFACKSAEDITGNAVAPGTTGTDIKVTETTVCTEDIATAQSKLIAAKNNLDKYSTELDKYNAELLAYSKQGQWDEAKMIQFDVEKYAKLVSRENENIAHWQEIISACS